MSAALWPYLLIVVAWIATDSCRFLGVVLAGRMREDTEILNWVRAVATALVAGVIARLIVFPVGPLADAPLALRVVSVLVGFGVYSLGGRAAVLVGIIAGEVTLFAGIWLLGY